MELKTPLNGTVENLYNTIYYSKYAIEFNIDKSAHYVALKTHEGHPIPHPTGSYGMSFVSILTKIDPCYKGFQLYWHYNTLFGSVAFYSAVVPQDEGDNSRHQHTSC